MYLKLKTNNDTKQIECAPYKHVNVKPILNCQFYGGGLHGSSIIGNMILIRINPHSSDSLLSFPLNNDVSCISALVSASENIDHVWAIQPANSIIDTESRST